MDDRTDSATETFGTPRRRTPGTHDRMPGVYAVQSAEDAGFEPARVLTPNTISNSTPTVLAGSAAAFMQAKCGFWTVWRCMNRTELRPQVRP